MVKFKFSYTYFGLDAVLKRFESRIPIRIQNYYRYRYV
jgi:hypothetical protein